MNFLSLVVGAALLAVALGAQSLPLYISPIEELIVDDSVQSSTARHASVSHAQTGKSRALLPSSRLPVGSRSENISGQYYVLKDFKIGNPPQSFNLTLRSDDHFSYVFNDPLSQEKCAVAPGQHKLFRTPRSTTIRFGRLNEVDVGGSINSNRSCESDDWDFFGEGIDVTDDIRLGTAKVPLKQIPFVVVSKIHATLDPHWHSDGVLGLMRNDGGYTKNLSTIHQLANALGSPEMSLFWKKNAKQGQQAGAITIGGRDAKNCDSKWSLFVPPKKSLINWELAASSWSVGSKSFGQTLIEFETVESGLALLPLAYLEVVLLTNAKYDAANGYTVDCSKISKFPSVDFVLPSADGSSFTLSVPAEDYVVKQDDGTCVLNISWDPDNITIGTSVKSYCWLLHYGKEMVGLAKALQ